MLAAVYTQALFIVADVAYLRGAGVVLAFVRTFLGRQRFVAFRMGWVEALCAVLRSPISTMTTPTSASMRRPSARTITCFRGRRVIPSRSASAGGISESVAPVSTRMVRSSSLTAPSLTR